MSYVLIAINREGRVRWALTQNPVVPDGWVHRGEVGMVLSPLDVQARHFHDIGADHVHSLDGPGGHSQQITDDQ